MKSCKKAKREEAEKPCNNMTRAWFDSFPESVFIMEYDGTILDSNETFAARFQKLPRECVGGEVCQLLIIGQDIHNDSFLVGMGIDITERKKSAEALEQSEEQFRKLFECHSAIQLILDPDTGHIVDANQAAEDFYGWSIATLKQMRIQEINTLSPEKVTQNLKKWLSSQQLSFTFRHLRADGSIRDVEVFANKIEITGKALVYCIIHDINQRKHLEALSAFRIRLFEMAAPHAVEALLLATVDEAERLTESTIGFCHFFGNTPLSSATQVISTNTQRFLEKSGAPPPSMIEMEFWAEAIEKRDAVIKNSYSSVESGISPPSGHPALMRTLLVPLLQGERVIAILGVANKPSIYDNEDIGWVKMVAEMAWDIISKKLKSIRPDLKTLFMSGYTADIATHHQKSGDETNFIQKPFSANTLIRAVNTSLKP